VPNLSRHRQTTELAAIGAVIRQARTEKGMSQENLALLAEVDRSYLGRVERGDNNVAVLTLVRIARALGLTLRQLIAKTEL
jgi:transcriptional regulator with XRE-family HTH domain